MRHIRLSIAAAVLALACLVTGASGFYSKGDDVINFTPDNFSEEVRKSDSIVLVEFYAPWCGHCRNLTPEWKKAASALKGIVKVGAVDADAHKAFGGDFSIKGFPTIKLLHSANGKLKVVDYQGSRTAAAIAEWALQQASKIALGRIGAKPSAGGSGGGRASGGSAGQGGCGAGAGGGQADGGESFYGAGTDVVQLTDANFHEEVSTSDDLWMVEYYAPWCGHCKNLKPEFEQFATSVKGKVSVGAVDCTANEATCQEFGVQGYPTIKWFGASKEGAVDYDGGRDEGSLTAYSLERWQQQMPPPEVKQLIDDEAFIAECAGSDGDAELGLQATPAKQLCFLLFVPNILDTKAAGRNAYIDVLKKLSEHFKTRPFSYLWAEGSAQLQLEAAFDVGGYGYPALIALSPSKLKYSSLRSAFEFDPVKAFVDRVRQGTERVQPIRGDALPELATTDAWDGTDGMPPEEDEFDLDDLMKEEL